MLISRFKMNPAGDDQTILGVMDRKVARPFLTKRRGVAVVVITLTILALVFGYVRYGITQFVTVDADRLTVATVERAVFHDYIPVTGAVVPRTTVYLDAVAGGQVAQVLVEEGALVKAGDALVVLQNAALQLDVAGREAALAQQLYQLTTINLSLDDRRLQRDRELTETEYQLRLLTSQLERKRPLLEGGYVSRTEIEDLERNLARTRSTYDSMKAAQAADDAARPEQVAQLKQSIALFTNNLAMTRRNLEALTITAPITGQLTLLDADVGASKAPGQRLGQVDSAEGFKVRANVDEFYLSRLAVGQKAETEIDERAIPMSIAKIYPGVKDRQFAVDLAFVGNTLPKALRRGQTLHLKLEVGEEADSLVS